MHSFNIITKSCVSAFFISCFLTLLRADVPVSWTAKFNNPVLWQRVTPIGNVVVNCSDAMYGVEPETGKIIWQINELGNIPADRYQLLPNSMFVEIINKTQSKEDVIILDPIKGKIICSTRDAGFYKIFSKNVLYASGGILVYGLKDKLKAELAMFDINTGKLLWSKDDIFGKAMALGGILATALTTPQENAASKPQELDLIEIDNSSFVVATMALHSIETKTGKQLWKSPFPQPKGMVSSADVSKLIKAPQGKSYFYYAKANYVMGYDAKTGKQVWKEIAKISGVVDRILYVKEGLILLPDQDPVNSAKPKVSLVDYETGNAYWGEKGKGLKCDGAVTGYEFLDDGILLSMQAGEDKSFLNILDDQGGKFRFENSLKIKGILQHSEITPKGLLYVTTSDRWSGGEVNIFNIKTGQPVFDKPLRSGTDPFLFASADDKLYVFQTDKSQLFVVDKSKGTVKPLGDKVSFEDGEVPKEIEIRSEGICLKSDQNVALLGFDGKKIYNVYYAPPRLPGIIRALLVANSIVAGLNSVCYDLAAESAKEASKQSDKAYERSMYNGTSDAYASAADIYGSYSKATMDLARKRFKASSQTKDFVFMMTQLEKQSSSGVGKALESRKFGLARIGKTDGKLIDIIYMGTDKEPNYEVDVITNQVYYQKEPKELVCYKL